MLQQQLIGCQEKDNNDFRDGLLRRKIDLKFQALDCLGTKHMT